MMREPGWLPRNFAHVLSGNTLYYACQWAIVLVLAKLGTPRQVGEYALGMAVSAPVLLFANFQLRALMASDVQDQFTFEQYFTFRLASLAAALIVVGGIAASTEADWRGGAIIVLAGFVQALDFASEACHGWMLKHGRTSRLSWSLAIKGPLSLAALCAAMYFTGSVVCAMLGLAAGRLAVLLTWDLRLGFQRVDAARFRFRARPRAMFRLLRVSFPLGVISMLGALSTSIPRYFLEAHRGSAELGIFSAIASLLSTGTLVISAFGQSVFLPVAKACAGSDRSGLRVCVFLAAATGAVLGGVGLLAAALFGRPILTHLFRPEYGEHTDVFVRLMMAAVVSFAASGMGYVVTAARSLGPQIPVLAATVIAAAAICAWAVPRRGLIGAADASLAAALVQLAGTGLIVRRIDRRLRLEAGPSMPVEDPAAAETSGVEA
jgi:O-antigen/teichoic acid export membrane protein